MNYDNYREVINGDDTYKEIAQSLKENKPILIGWTPENGTHFDVLFTSNPMHEDGELQGGIDKHYLFVSVMRMGAWAFRTDLNRLIARSYIKDKIGMDGEEAKKLGELVGGVIKELHEL